LSAPLTKAVREAKPEARGADFMRTVFGREALFSISALLISAILVQTIYATVIRRAPPRSSRNPPFPLTN